MIKFFKTYNSNLIISFTVIAYYSNLTSTLFLRYIWCNFFNLSHAWPNLLLYKSLQDFPTIFAGTRASKMYNFLPWQMSWFWTSQCQGQAFLITKTSFCVSLKSDVSLLKHLCFIPNLNHYSYIFIFCTSIVGRQFTLIYCLGTT